MTPWTLSPARLVCPWDFPGKNTEVGCHFFLLEIFLTQRSNPPFLCLLHWRRILYAIPSGKPHCYLLSIWNLRILAELQLKGKERKRFEEGYLYGISEIFFYLSCAIFHKFPQWFRGLVFFKNNHIYVSKMSPTEILWKRIEIMSQSQISDMECFVFKIYSLPPLLPSP